MSDEPAPRLLVVDDEPSVLETIAAILAQEGYDVVAAGSLSAALARVEETSFDLILTDLRIEEDSGLTLLAEVRERWPETTVVVLTGYASLESAIDALRKGAYDYLIKPCNVEELKATVARAVERGILARALRLRVEELDAANEKLRSFSAELQQRVDEATRALVQKVEELDEAKQGLEAANRQREEFISMVAHDLAGPLTTIGAYAQLLNRDKMEPATQEKARQAILSETQRLGRLIKDLADASHLSLGGFTIQPVPCDLAALIQQQVEQARITSNGHQFRIDLPDAPIATAGDRDRLAQVLSNLLANAVKYAPRGNIGTSLRAENESAIISVSDDGPGIPLERLEAIFEPGVRLVGNTGQGTPKGAGLGLYIARGIINAHGGRIWAESTPGKGTTFWISLPLLATTAAPDEAKVG